MHKISHKQGSKGFPNGACHPPLACELLASVMSPSDPSELPLPIFDSEGAFSVALWG